MRDSMAPTLLPTYYTRAVQQMRGIQFFPWFTLNRLRQSYDVFAGVDLVAETVVPVTVAVVDPVSGSGPCGSGPRGPLSNSNRTLNSSLMKRRASNVPVPDFFLNPLITSVLRSTTRCLICSSVSGKPLTSRQTEKVHPSRQRLHPAPFGVGRTAPFEH